MTCAAIFGVTIVGLSFGLLMLTIYVSDSPDGHSDNYIEQTVQRRFLETDFDCHDKDVYRCGWVYTTTVYEATVAFDLYQLQLQRHAKTRTPGVFFAVLKHSILHFYTSEEQSECVCTVPMELVTVEAFPHTLFMDEIYSKEHPLRLFHDRILFENESEFYLYAASASDKEDWLVSLRRASGIGTFRSDHTRELFLPYIHTLYDNIHMLGDQHDRWLNALAGRIFFNIHKSSDIRQLLFTKISRKLEYARRPFFLNASVDLFYPGGFRLQVETEARINITSTRPIIVPLVLTISIKEISGRIMLRIKPPPSDRLWFGFYRPPKLDISVEPIVSARTITWHPIHQLIVKKFQEALLESVVLPNMDDIAIPPLVYGDLFAGERPFDSLRIPKTLLEDISHRKHFNQDSSPAANALESEEEPTVDLVMQKLIPETSQMFLAMRQSVLSQSVDNFSK